MPDALLKVADLHGWYGESHILHGMEFQVPRGELVTLLGRNGAGKTTTLKAIMGLLKQRKGSVAFDGAETIAMAPHRIARLGVALCPEERGMTDAEIDTLFPRLRERWGNSGAKLSGGEQQMLAIARILRTGATLLLLDEPTEGLAPVIVQQIRDALLELKRRGLTILLVEQNFRFASTVADRHYVVEHGQVVDHMTNDEIAENAERLEAFLGV